MVNKNKSDVAALIKEIQPTIFTRRVTLTGFLLLMLLLKFVFNVHFSFLIILWLFFWVLTSFLLVWAVRKQTSVKGVNRAHFRHLFF